MVSILTAFNQVGFDVSRFRPKILDAFRFRPFDMGFETLIFDPSETSNGDGFEREPEETAVDIKEKEQELAVVAKVSSIDELLILDESGLDGLASTSYIRDRKSILQDNVLAYVFVPDPRLHVVNDKGPREAHRTMDFPSTIFYSRGYVIGRTGSDYGAKGFGYSTEQEYGSLGKIQLDPYDAQPSTYNINVQLFDQKLVRPRAESMTYNSLPETYTTKNSSFNFSGSNPFSGINYSLPRQEVRQPYMPKVVESRINLPKLEIKVDYAQRLLSRPEIKADYNLTLKVTTLSRYTQSEIKVHLPKPQIPESDYISKPKTLDKFVERVSFDSPIMSAPSFVEKLFPLKESIKLPENRRKFGNKNPNIVDVVVATFNQAEVYNEPANNNTRPEYIGGEGLKQDDAGKQYLKQQVIPRGKEPQPPKKPELDPQKKDPLALIRNKIKQKVSFSDYQISIFEKDANSRRLKYGAEESITVIHDLETGKYYHSDGDVVTSATCQLKPLVALALEHYGIDLNTKITYRDDLTLLREKYQFRGLEDGNTTTLREASTRMLQYSSNSDFNHLLAVLGKGDVEKGMQRVNDYAQLLELNGRDENGKVREVYMSINSIHKEGAHVDNNVATGAEINTLMAYIQLGISQGEYAKVIAEALQKGAGSNFSGGIGKASVKIDGMGLSGVSQGRYTSTIMNNRFHGEKLSGNYINNNPEHNHPTSTHLGQMLAIATANNPANVQKMLIQK